MARRALRPATNHVRTAVVRAGENREVRFAVTAGSDSRPLEPAGSADAVIRRMRGPAATRRGRGGDPRNDQTALRTTAARPKRAPPTTNSFAPSGSEWRIDAAADSVGAINAGAATAGVAVATGVYGTSLVGADSSDSANPTGTTNAATVAASNKTRYRFRIARFCSTTAWNRTRALAHLRWVAAGADVRSSIRRGDLGTSSGVPPAISGASRGRSQAGIEVLGTRVELKGTGFHNLGRRPAAAAVCYARQFDTPETSSSMVDV